MINVLTGFLDDQFLLSSFSQGKKIYLFKSQVSKIGLLRQRKSICPKTISFQMANYFFPYSNQLLKMVLTSLFTQTVEKSLFNEL